MPHEPPRKPGNAASRPVPRFGCSRAICFALLLALCPASLLLAAPKDRVLRTEANVPIELTFTASRTYADPFNDIALDVTFIDPRGRELRAPAFWAGGQTWKARYASPVPGTHTFRSEASDTRDTGLHGITGKVEIKPYSGQNPLYLHGPLQVSHDRRYLEHADHTPFFWLGDTWWMGLCHRLHWPDEFQQLTADRKAKGFNVIQIVAGLYPDMPPFDPRGANEAGFPWETNYARIRPEYFDAADQRLDYLVQQGFTPCIVGAWGYFMPWMGVDKMKTHWRYLIARYGAWPVVWCAAGEANLPWYLAKGFPYDDRRQVRDWTEVMRFIRATDPFHRPLTIHPTGLGRLSARNATDDAALLDFDMLQTPHGRREAVPVTVKTVRESYADTPIMPVIDGEASYEMLSDSLPTEWTRRMFWLCMMNGAAGHTYGANGIWQCNRPGQPHGASPHGGTYGKIPWNEAMNLPGSRQVGLGKKLLEQYPWQVFKPHPGWAAFAEQAPLTLRGSQWIWLPQGNPAQDAPAGKAFFRRVFVLPEGKPISGARLSISADDAFSARINGHLLGGGEEWHSPKQFIEFAHYLRPGTNVLTVIAENKPTTLPANPAGLIAAVDIQFADGGSLSLTSDASWRCARGATSGWEAAAFDDAAWPKALAIGAYGIPPWGEIGGGAEEPAYGPQATGIPGVVRVIYVPESKPIVVRTLEQSAGYALTCFDPVTGQTRTQTAQSDAAGQLICPPPSGNDHDWVLIVQPPQPAHHATRSTQQASDAPGSGQTAPHPFPLPIGWAEGGRRTGEGSLHAPIAPLQTVGPLHTHDLTLSDAQLSWHFDWSDGHLRSSWFENKRSGHRFSLAGSRELALNFSAATNKVEQPFLRAADFEVADSQLIGPEKAVFQLRSPSLPIAVRLHVELDGPTRRKWVEVANHTARDLLLLDVELDDLVTDGTATEGGQGQPVFLEDEAFAAIEHPAGVNVAAQNRIQLSHYPGRLLAPGATFTSRTALVSVAQPGHAREHFVSYIQAKSLRPKRAISIYTPFGINNQWGACPTGDDEQVLNLLDRLAQWQKKGVRFDYFTLDTGWVDPNSDLTRFRPTCFPNGPGEIVRRVEALGMKFGLWFATSWAAESCWDYPPALAGQPAISMPYRLGYPDKAHEGRMYCFASEPYFQTLKNAVLYHVRENHARLLKFDGGNYTCDNPDHGHLPGKYSVEPMLDHLVDIADSARALAPDVFVIWYWGLRSPFWALYGDMIFESGLPMEGSGTSPCPTLYYRDSVTLAQDQNAQFARNIPPLVKDSLGVWLADNRWGNFMGKERWREALVMDLGRGNLLLPNFWGNLYYLNDDDLAFLARMNAVARQNEALFLHRRSILGDPFRNEPYGYAYGQGSHAFLFMNNANFESRHVEVSLDSSIGLDANPGTGLHVVSHFPDQTRLLRPDGAPLKAGDDLAVWLRPFEVLMLEVTPHSEHARSLPVRSVSREAAAGLGQQLALHPTALDASMDVRFADAASFAAQHLTKKVYAFDSTLPSLTDGQTVLAVPIRLRQGSAEWKHAPTVVQIVQAIAHIGDQDVQLIPVPDGRQFGNTQSYGCSWVLYKVRLGPQWSGKPLKLAIHAMLPDNVDAHVEAWIVNRWWQPEAHPHPDGYYNDAPS
ncbi:MAG TPA: DUF4038 domain-containing protein [Candidatus Acidoferrum sp.]|nr:DUF4038 domain-containing protein [Candidatus Acidoferrum sp.]